MWSSNEKENQKCASLRARASPGGAGAAGGGADLEGRSPEDSLRTFCLNEDIWWSEAELQAEARQL